jgi:hypothetical protein
MERDKPKQSESVGQTVLQLPWKQKRGDLKNIWIPFIKLHETLWEYPPYCVAALEGLKKIQNDGRCHGNQGAKNVKFTPNSGSF